MTPELMVEKIKDAIDNRKGRDIEVIPLAEKTIIADYFVICSGTSTTHLRGIADEVIEKLWNGSAAGRKKAENAASEKKDLD